MNALLGVLISLLLIVAQMTGEVCQTYHFVITKVHPAQEVPIPTESPDGTVLAPSYITIETMEGDFITFELDRVTGQTAHYQGEVTGTIKTAFTYIDNMWVGQFNQSSCKPTAVMLPTFAAEDESFWEFIVKHWWAFALAFVLVMGAYAVMNSGRHK